MTVHRCQCYVCAPNAFPPIPERGAEYGAVQNRECRPVPEWALWQHGEIGGHASYMYHVDLNGERQTGQTSGRCVQEALAGVVGWIVYEGHTSEPRECVCGSGAYCQQVEYGYVQLVDATPVEPT